MRFAASGPQVPCCWGWVWCACRSSGLSLLGLVVDDRIITGSPAWLKPAKFAISSGLYCITLAWLLASVARPSRLLAVGGGDHRGGSGRGGRDHRPASRPGDDEPLQRRDAAGRPSCSRSWGWRSRPCWWLRRWWRIELCRDVVRRSGVGLGAEARDGDHGRGLDDRRLDGPPDARAGRAGAGDGVHADQRRRTPSAGRTAAPGLWETGWSREHGDLRVPHFFRPPRGPGSPAAELAGVPGG